MMIIIRIINIRRRYQKSAIIFGNVSVKSLPKLMILKISVPDLFPVKRKSPKSIQFKRMSGTFTKKNNPFRIF